MDSNGIFIAMATYNGERFVKQQIQSILDQSHRDWKLLIRDDGSTDNTLRIIKSYAQQDERIVLIEDQFGNLGVSSNFELLSQKAFSLGCKYLLFSDHDDVWVEDKISTLLQAVKSADEKSDYREPLLVYSDLYEVDENLNVVSKSYMNSQGIRHEKESPLNVLLTQNFVTGCSVIVNRALLNFALPFPSSIVIHDWWLALCTAVCGKIIYIDRPLLYYRQHDSNRVGVKRLRNYISPMIGRGISRWEEGKKNLYDSIGQAKSLAERLRENGAGSPYLALIDAYASLGELSSFQRIYKMRKLGVHTQSMIRQVLLYSRLLLFFRVK